MSRPAKLTSGGQSGADLGALRAAKTLGIPSGGWMPRGWRTEHGPRPWYHTQFGMAEHVSPLYRDRTRANVIDADVTLIVGDLSSPGSKAVIGEIEKLNKWLIKNPQVEDLAAVDLTGKILNVAGNRESGNAGIEAYVYWLLVSSWGTWEMGPVPMVPRLWPPV